MRTLIVLALVLCASTCARATDYTTFHFDNARDGWNNTESRLTQATAARIAKAGDYALDGEVDAQPLYFHGVIYVVTENDTVYAISPKRGILWHRNFGTPVLATYVKCYVPAPTIGIESTPVIDRAADRMYFASYAMVDGKPAYTLHALSPRTGGDEGSADITHVLGDASVYQQRPGLLEAGGNVYVGFASFCDHHPERTYGRVLAYAASNLRLQHEFVTTRSPRCGSYHMGTIWGLGFAPASDAHGNVYVSTGNGCLDFTRLPDGGYGDAVLRLTPDLHLTSLRTALFAPCDAYKENPHDQELGSAGVVLAPGTPFAITGGKTGVTYVLDRANLGGFHTPCPDRVVFEAPTNWGIWGGPVAWRSGTHTFVGIAGSGPQGIETFALGATGALSLRSQTGVRLYNGGESAMVSSDAAGTPSSVVLWLLTRPSTGTMYLQAYDPLNLQRGPLASVAAGSWANASGFAAVSPTVADGYVFVATNKELTIWSAQGDVPASNQSVQFLVAGLLLAVAAGLAMRYRNRVTNARSFDEERVWGSDARDDRLD